MRLIKVTGGLGNQMFIYAMYLSMRRRFPGVRLDISDMAHYKVHYGYEMNRVFGLPPVEFHINWRLKKVVEFLFFKVVLERKQGGAMQPYLCRYAWPLVYFKGFYQSERYFADVADEVRRAFTFDMGRASSRSLSLAQQIVENPCAVSLHVRRGDYVSPKHWKSLGSVCQLPYYRHAIAELERRVSAPCYYVFSDDMDWVWENLPLRNAVYVDWNKGEDSWQDMMLMSLCRHHVICNSTFSWWGAWLGQSPQSVVVAPRHWAAGRDSKGIVPERWITVE